MFLKHFVKMSRVSDERKLRLVSVSCLLFVISLCVVSAYPPQSGGGWGGGGGGGSSSNLGKGSQIYLQDPWNHEHNYYQSTKGIGPHAHGWGSGSVSQGHPAHGNAVQMPESATYLQ